MFLFSISISVLCLPVYSSLESVLKLANFIAQIFKLTSLNMHTKSAVTVPNACFYITLNITTCKYLFAFTPNVEIFTNVAGRLSEKFDKYFKGTFFSYLAMGLSSLSILKLCPAKEWVCWFLKVSLFKEDFVYIQLPHSPWQNHLFFRLSPGNWICSCAGTREQQATSYLGRMMLFNIMASQFISH